MLVDAATTVEETCSFNMVALVATYNNNIIINKNIGYLLITSVDGVVETGSQLKVAWFSRVETHRTL